MRILWQAYDTVNYTGGPIVNALRVLPELKKRGHEVSAVIEYFKEHPNADLLKASGIQCYTFARPKYAEDHVRAYLEHIIAFKPDVFVSNISGHAGLAGHWALKWGIPVIHTIRGDDALNNGMAEFFFAGEQKWKLSALVAVNQYLLDKIQALTRRPIRYEIIPSGVPLSSYKADQSAARKLRVAYAGRLIDKIKRISDVVNAFIHLSRISEDIDFTIIGSGHEGLTQKLKSRVNESGFENRIHFAGKLDGDDYKKALASHHVIVLLSDSEGMPGSLMDGMSCGLVPVVCAVNGIDELIIDHFNGLVVHDRFESFTDAVLKLKHDEGLRKKLSSEALQTIISRFSLEHVTSEWEKLFFELKHDMQSKKYMALRMPTKISFRGHPLLIDYRSKPGLMEKFLRKLKKLRKVIKILKIENSKDL